MAGTADETLIARSQQGDHDALAELLLARYEQLEAYLRGKIPADMRSFIAVEDLIQEVHIQVFRKIDSFDPQGQEAFDRWLITIAKKRLLDKIKEQRRHKRGGARKRVHRPCGASSIATLVEVVARESRTPSISLAQHERQRAVQVGLAGLKDDYREALTLRYLEGLPVADIARRMERTERAVHMLCNRGIKKLKETLGSASTYMSRG